MLRKQINEAKEQSVDNVETVMVEKEVHQFAMGALIPEENTVIEVVQEEKPKKKKKAE